jgi:diguanylate cyclase (GGDEF)-like protein/PAS domain S-box-containing protein
MPQLDFLMPDLCDAEMLAGQFAAADAEFERLTTFAVQLGGLSQAVLALLDSQQNYRSVAAAGLDRGDAEALCAAVTASPRLARAAAPAVAHPFSYTLADGATTYCLTAFPLRAADGLVQGLLIVADRVARALTGAQTAALNAVVQQILTSLTYRRQRQEGMRQLADAMPCVVWTADAEGQTDYVNKAWKVVIDDADGVAENIQPTWLRALHPEDRAPALARWKSSVAAGQPSTMEYRVLFQGYSYYRWQLVRAQPIHDANGKIVKWYGTVVDIHDSKLNQEKMQVLATRLNDTLESITDALLTFDHDWHFTYVNPEGERILNVAHGELLGEQLWQRFPLFVGTRFEAACRRAVAEQRTMSVDEFYSPLAIWLEVHIYCLEGGLAVYFRDVSARKSAEAEVRRAAQIQARIIAAQRDISATGLDLQSVMDLVAERAQELTGAAGAVVSLVDGSHMVCRAGTGIARDYPGTRVRRDSSLAGAASLQQSVVTCEDTELDARVDQVACRKMGGRSAIVAPLRSNNQVVGVVQVMYLRPHAFGESEINNFQILVESMGSVIERQRVNEQLQVSEAQYRLLFNSNSQPIWIYEQGTLAILAVNSAAIRTYGYTEQQFIGMTLRDVRPDDEVEKMEQAVQSMFDNDCFGELGVWRHRKQDGSVIDVEIRANRIVFNGKLACMAQITDITRRICAEQELLRINRGQRLLSACNEALVRAHEESDLLAEICRAAVEIGGYRMSWIAYAEDDAQQSILPVALHGETSGYFDGQAFSWGDRAAGGYGPAGRAIVDGQSVVIEDIAANTDFPAWRGRAMEYGYRSVICLPLAEQRRPFGSLNLYGEQVIRYSNDELNLLQSLANDLSYGIAKLRAQADQRRMHDTILKVAAGVSGASGATFFEQLAGTMADALGADAAIIAHLEGEQTLRSRTIAAVVDGQVIDNFSYAASGTPSEQLRRCEDYLVMNNVVLDQIPMPLSALAPQAYVGRRLLGSAGQVLGIIFVLFRAPLRQSDFIASTLQIFAARAASELERKDADARIREQASLLDKAQDAIVVRGIDDKILFWNKGAERLYGWTSAEVLGREITELVSNEPAASARATERVMRLREWSGELTQVRKDGSRFSVEGHWTLIEGDDGRPQSIFEINTDITERKVAEEKILQLAFYDALTRLPNRILLMDRLQEALLASARSGETGALLFIDLDNFKTLNDTLGHDVGDALLRKVTHRLVSCVRETDTVARLGGDEFVVLLENLAPCPHEAAIVARNIGEKIIVALNERYQLGDFAHNSTASIGITLFSDAHNGLNELLKRADLAMYQAKAAGRNTLRFFDPAMQQLVSVRVELESDLRLALTRQEFDLHYQPQVNGLGQVFGAEALIRWHHPQRGMVSPFDFISVAEETGLILPIGHWVLTTACEQLVRWAGAAQTSELVLAVNVSARQFRQPDFVDQVLAVLAQTGADPTRLKLELTESLLVDSLDETIEKMSALKECGVGFSLDDFGTGYSSLAYLKRLPLDQLKIDKSFVRDVLQDPNDAAIACTIVALAQSLGLSVIAEGVETEAQRDFLAENGCPTYQGYFFSRPLPITQFEALL